MKLLFATAIVALTLPVLALADVSGTPTLTAAAGALNLDAGTTGASGGDLKWDGSTLTPQGSATAALAPVSGSQFYNTLTSSQTLMLFAQALNLSGAAISAPAANAIILVHTNGGNWAKILVTSNSGGSLGLQYTTFGASGTAPSITAVENAATNIPPGFPNSGIAQGSLFVVKGANLGPATFIQQTSFPFTTNIGGTSIQVTVNGTKVDAIMFYSLARQVSAILPSKTPTGTGTLTLTYNGQTATAPITVVNRNVGIYTLSQSGTGDAVAFINSDSGLITPTHAANPDDVVVFWGTGLGPVTLDETVAVGANQADLGDIGLHVYIGGQEANIVFKGRNGCCTSVDTVYVTVPHNVSGCKVGVLMRMADMVSNATSIAIAQNGRTCTPVNGNGGVGATGTFSSGSVFLNRSVSASSKSDSAEGAFIKVTYTSPPSGSQLDINSYGSCSVQEYLNSQPPPSSGTVTYLDAGPSIGLTAPFGTKTLAKMTFQNFVTYDAQLDQTATTLTGGQYTFTGTGGADVGAFTANYSLPAVFTWTDQSSITTVNRSNGVTVHWSGGNPAGYVTISGSSTSGTAFASFICTARVSDLMFTVPSVVLLALPASSGPNSGSLSVDASDYQQITPAPSPLNYMLVGSDFFYGTSVSYQ